MALTAAISFIHLAGDRRLERQVQERSRALRFLTLTCDISISLKYFFMKLSDNVNQYIISVQCEFR